jgi:hypothetical protein
MTLTLTPLPTHTPSPSPTPTAYPTLPVEQARARLLELLATNGNCRLPCLWGITPGKTTFEEARTILQPLAGISRHVTFGYPTDFENNILDSMDALYDEGDLETSADIRYLFVSDGIINRIVFKGSLYKKIFRGKIIDSFHPIYDSKVFGERLFPYMLPGILSKLGKPTSVVMQTYRYGNGIQISNSGAFEIILVYPDQGIFVHYLTKMQVVGPNARACPAIAQVELELYPSGNADHFAKSLARETYWGVFAKIEPIDIDTPFWKSIEHATSMTLDQFYKTFSQPINKCIETPINLWATPEPGGG